MRILLIDVVCKSGSTGKIVYDLYQSCTEAGHEAAVCYGRGKKLKEENLYKFGLDGETLFHALMTRITGYTGCFSPLSTKRLLRFMDVFQPDIVHLHEPHAYFMNLRPFYEYLAKHEIPLVYTMHCEFGYTGKCGVSYDCERWKTGCGNCPRLKEYPRTAFFDHTAAMYTEKKRLMGLQKKMIVTTPSRWLADRAAQSLLKGRDIRVIPNGINTEQCFHPRPFAHLKERHQITDEKIVLAVAPNFVTNEKKGGHYVLKLAERFQGEKLRFILIGADGTFSQVPENTIVLGRTENQTELAEYYSMADCYVMCSEMENLPTTCLEAVCCGTPVVGFDVGGAKETAPDPLGYFSAYGDLDALEENLRHMLTHPPEATLFAPMRQRYSDQHMYAAYAKIYREIMDGAAK